MSTFIPNADLDLVLDRTVSVTPERVWAAWTEPALLLQCSRVRTPSNLAASS